MLLVMHQDWYFWARNIVADDDYELDMSWSCRVSTGDRGAVLEPLVKK